MIPYHSLKRETAATCARLLALASTRVGFVDPASDEAEAMSVRNGIRNAVAMLRQPRPNIVILDKSDGLVISMTAELYDERKIVFDHTRIILTQGEIEMRLALDGKPELAHELVQAGLAITRTILRKDCEILPPYGKGEPSVTPGGLLAMLAGAMTESFVILADRLLDDRTRTPVDAAIADANHVLALCDAMAEAVRPSAVHGVVVDVERRRVEAYLANRTGRSDTASRFDLPTPRHLLDRLPAEPVIRALVVPDQDTDGDGEPISEPGVTMLFTPFPEPRRHTPDTNPSRLAALLREHGGDGSEVAAAIDAALALQAKRSDGR